MVWAELLLIRQLCVRMCVAMERGLKQTTFKCESRTDGVCSGQITERHWECVLPGVVFVCLCARRIWIRTCPQNPAVQRRAYVEACAAKRGFGAQRCRCV